MSNSVTVAVDLLVRVSLLLGLAFLVALVLSGRSASLRHLVWSASLGGSLIMAVMVPWSPRMDVPLKWWRISRTPAVVTAPALVPTRDGREGSVPVPMRTVVNDDAERVSSSITTLARGRTPVPVWLTLWLAGAALVLLWGVWGRIGLARIVRRARRVTNGPWVSVVNSTSLSSGIRRPVAVFVSTEVGAPMTWGTRQPVLVVPTESEAWTDDLRRAVAAHELAHVARNDYAMQLMALVTCAVYWFHPLAWMTARRMRLAAEKACDDQVLSLGTTGEDYAAHLVGIARSARSLRLAGAVAIGMARASTLEGRIMAVLDSTRRRGAPTSRGRRAIGITAAVALMLLGGMRPVPALARIVVSFTPSEEVVNTPAPIRTASERSVVPTLPATPSIGQGQQSSKVDIVNASAGEELYLDLASPGGDVIVRGWDEPRVRVRTRLAGTDWQDVEVRVERQSSGVRVRSRYTVSRNNQSSDNHFEINVPRRFDVRISSAGGALTLMDIEGRFSGHTGGGGLVLERLKGSASLTTGGGEIRVSDSDLSGRVQTGGGMVMLSQVRGGLRGTSGSGPVIYGESTVTTDDSTLAVTTRGSTSSLSSVSVNDSRVSVGSNYRGGSLTIDKAGGDIDLDAAPNGARVFTGGGRVTVGRAGGDVRATTGGGDVTVGPASGSVRARTGAGEVHVIVDRSPSADQMIEASSGSGRVIIELPGDFDGRLELETAHTATHERTARITSDFELNREPLTDWDDRYGSPRRYLRASAVLGRANRRVIVRTVNGEIEIRRR